MADKTREQKKMDEKHNLILQELLKMPENKICADCQDKGPRWASWNLGCFLCLNCAGVHRRMGTHISRVKSVTLDSWTPEQIESIRTKGNAYSNSVFDPNPENHKPCPRGDDAGVEQWIRDKYERKLWANPSSRSNPERSKAAPPKEKTMSEAEKNSIMMSRLAEMGFKDAKKNRQAIAESNGDLDEAVKILVKQAVANAQTQSEPVVTAPQRQQFNNHSSNQQSQQSQPKQPSNNLLDAFSEPGSNGNSDFGNFESFPAPTSAPAAKGNSSDPFGGVDIFAPAVADPVAEKQKK